VPWFLATAVGMGGLGTGNDQADVAVPAMTGKPVVRFNFEGYEEDSSSGQYGPVPTRREMEGYSERKNQGERGDEIWPPPGPWLP
jgi:hypothetical protein